MTKLHKERSAPMGGISDQRHRPLDLQCSACGGGGEWLGEVVVRGQGEIQSNKSLINCAVTTVSPCMCLTCLR